jgi:hypothetical protein
MEGWNTTWLSTTPVETQEVMSSQGKLIIIKEIFLDKCKQMLKTSYTLNLRQLFKIALELKRYLWQKLKPEKIQNVSKATIDKQVGSLIPKVGTIAITIDNHMVVIHVQIGKNTIEIVLLMQVLELILSQNN